MRARTSAVEMSGRVLTTTTGMPRIVRVTGPPRSSRRARKERSIVGVPSDLELPQVVVGVPVGEHPPLPRRERTEGGMHGPLPLRRLGGEARDECAEGVEL